MFSYKKVSKHIQEHNMGVVQALQSHMYSDDMAAVSTHEIRICRSLFVVVFAFMLFWIPSWVIVIFKRFHVIAKTPRATQLLCTFLVILSNTLSPIIYAGMNPLCRREFRRLLLCKAGERIEDNAGSTRRPNRVLTPFLDDTITL